MNPKIPVVAILTSPALKGNRSLIRGILDYAQRHGPWRFVMLEGREGEQTFDLAKLRCDAVVINIATRADVRAIAALNVPVILCEPQPLVRLMASGSWPLNCPMVRMDSRGVGVMAAKYYLERGYGSFAYVGETLDLYWSAERRDGFVSALREAGYEAVIYEGPRGMRERRCWDAERPRLIRFLTSLPRPTAVFAAMDGRGRLVVDACLEAGLRVPEDIAVLGVDDDPILCRSCVPPLSSIRTGGYQRGVRIAELLDDLMQGRAVARTTFVYEPYTVVTRGSTGYAAMQDPVLARALSFIHRHAADSRCSTEVVVAAAQCSRRYLEKKFRSRLGLSIRELIIREKIEHAKILLEKGSMPIGEIPAACGLNCNSHLSVLFKKATGSTMRAWRNNHQDVSDE